MNTAPGLLPALASPRALIARYHDFFTGCGIFVVYIAVAQLGYALYAMPTVVTPIAGVTLTLLYLYGLEYAPVILLAAFVSYIANGAPLGTLIVLPLAQTAQGVIGVYLLRYLDFDLMLNRLRDVISVMIVSLVVSTIVPTAGLFALYLNHAFFGRPASTLTWGIWWVGMITSTLIVFPFLVRWVGKFRWNHRSLAQFAEITVVLGFLVVVNYFLFWTKSVQILGISLVYVLLAPFFWLALRVGPRFTTLALLFTTVIGIGGTFYGVSAATGAVLAVRLFQVEILLDILAVIFLILVSLEEERKDALKAVSAQVGELEEALLELHSQERLRSEFLAVLAHELRNPLAPLVSSVEVLKLDGLVDERGTRILDVMSNQLRRVRRLLDDLLDIARLSQQKFTLHRALVDVSSVVGDSALSVKSVLEGRKQRLVVEAPDGPIMLDGDATRLEQACINLLNNASKFSAEGSVVSLSTRLVGGRVEIAVRDEGVGIEPQLMSRIFEPFQQGRLGGKNDGLGVGLNLAKNIVEMHDGTLTVASPGRGKGSVFTIRLPVSALPVGAAHAGAKKSESPAPEAGKYRVLVVDDNRSAAESLSTLLSMKGYVAEHAYDGAGMLVHMEQFKPHAIVLDIGLPDTDGYALARQLRGRRFSGMLIALTGYGQDDDKKRSREAGFDHHLTKPIGIAELHALLVERQPALRL